jgi:DNA-binding NarL/FixJ family response regulator
VLIQKNPSGAHVGQSMQTDAGTPVVPTPNEQLTAAVVATATALRDRIVTLLGADGVSVLQTASELRELDGRPPVIVIALDVTPHREELRALRARFSSSGIVLVTAFGHAGRTLNGARWADADAVVLQDRLELALAPTVRAVQAEQVVFPRSQRRRISGPALSHREKQVLRLVVEGCTNDEIADALFLSTSTVKSHLTSAFAKLSVHSRSEAAALLMDPDEPVGRAVLHLQIREDGRRAEDGS